MIIKRIDIINYGKWHHVMIPLQKGLNILYGRNEAGKTTLLSFIKGVLFGYLQRRTSHKNYIPRNSNDYGGQLEVSVNDHDYIIKRMAGKNGGNLTILNDHGDQLDNSLLKKILGPFDRNTFNALYYFGNVNLKQIGKLKQRDLIYRIQRIGLAHSNDWIDYRETLDKQSKKLYSPRGYKPVLNQKLKLYPRLMKRLNDAKQSYQTYQDLLRQTKQLIQKRNALSTKLKLQDQRTTQLNHDQNIWTRYQKMESLTKLIKQPSLTRFTDKDGQRLNALIDQLTRTKARIKLIRQEAHEASSQRINVDSMPFYQQHRKLIKSLSDRFNLIQEWLEKLQVLKRNDLDTRNQLKHLISKYSVNGHHLRPLKKNDYVTVNRILHQSHVNQNHLQKLTRQMVLMQKSSRSGITTRDSVVYGTSILLLVVGLVTLVPLSGLGLILGIGWLIYRNHNVHNERIQTDDVQNQINGCQRIASQIKSKVQDYQEQYYYPTQSIERWLGMQDGLQRLVQLQNDAEGIKAKKKQLSDQLDSYFKQWAFMNRELTLSSDLVSQLQQLKNYVGKMNRSFKVNQQANDQYYKYIDQLKASQKQARDQHNQLITFYHDRQIKGLDEFKDRQHQQRQLNQRKQLYDELSKQISSAEIKILHRYSGYADLQMAVNQVNQSVENLQSRLRKISARQAAVQVKFRQLVRDGSYDELQQRVANLRTEINGLVKNWLETSLASQWINTTLNLATKGRVPKIEQQAQLNFRVLTNQRYDSIIFNKTQIKVMRNDKHRFTLYELSKGTVQQLYLALIFAMSQVFSTDYPMPLLIDDGFTDFDVIRRQAAVKLLRSIGRQLQVIYCTSDENLASSNGVRDLNQV